jgi:hypothetical protein
MRVSDIIKSHKLYGARVFVKQPGYQGHMDVTVSAPDFYVARQLIKRLYNVPEYKISNLREIKFQ